MPDVAEDFGGGGGGGGGVECAGFILGFRQRFRPRPGHWELGLEFKRYPKPFKPAI